MGVWPFRFTMHGKRGLRMMVVSLLSSSPKNGVEIIDGVEAMTRGWWRPSPGSIYPLLEKMTDEGTVRKKDDGRYELTPKANAELEVSFGPRFRTLKTSEELFRELQNLVSFAEDLARTRPNELLPQKDKLRDLAKRLDDLGK
jgi:DNA-binding PadR family transcriptional regulator